MAGIDRTVMTEEAIALRRGETVNIDGVMVRFTERERLDVALPEGMTGEQCDRWLRKNAARMGYIPVSKPAAAEGKPAKRQSKDDDEFKPLEPYVES